MGTILGTGVGFGIGFALGLWVKTPIEEADGGIPFLLVFFLVMLGVPAIAGAITKERSIAGVFLLVSLFSLGAFANAVEWVNPLFAALFLAIPFAALGGSIGYTIAARRVRPPTPVEEREGAEQSKARFEEEQKREEERRRREEEQRRRQEDRRRFEEEQRRREEARARFEWESRAEETYYDILGVSRNATQDEIKKAYDGAITKCHPDKFFNQPEWLRKEAEQMSKKLNEAYEVLSDPNKRKEYGRGL